MEPVDLTGQCKRRFGSAGVGGSSRWRRLQAVWVEGPTQGQWWLTLQPLPRSHTTQSFPICLWSLLSCCPSARAQVSACKQARLCVGPFRRRQVFQVPSVSPGGSEFVLIFTARFCGNCLPGTGAGAVELGPLAPSGEPLQPGDPSLCSAAPGGSFPVSAPPTSLDVVSSLYTQ